MITINFKGFWPGFDYKDNLFFNYLIDNEIVTFDTINPDITIFSDYYNSSEIDLNQKRILYSPENAPINSALFKYRMTFRKETGENFNFQNFFYYPYFREEAESNYSVEFLALKNRKKDKHINFIYSNSKASLRNSYFQYLSRSFDIDSFGRHMNNMGLLENQNHLTVHSRTIEKLNIISRYKFTIAFENSFGDGYISEKIWEPLCVNSIPIYFGHKSVFEYFNKNKIIYISDKNDFQKSISIIKEIDSSESMYKQYLNESIFKDEETRARYTYSNLASQFLNFIEKVKLDNQPISHKKIKMITYAISKGYFFLFK